jgi:hypothetical protein
LKRIVRGDFAMLTFGRLAHDAPELLRQVGEAE